MITHLALLSLKAFLNEVDPLEKGQIRLLDYLTQILGKFYVIERVIDMKDYELIRSKFLEALGESNYNGSFHNSFFPLSKSMQDLPKGNPVR